MNPGQPLAERQVLDHRYSIRKVLGQGGMGRVYMANDTRLANRPVAIKEMVVGDALHERKAVEDFAREARVLALLSHPGIPKVIDFFVEVGRHYLVMEFVAGSDLQGMLDKLGPKARMPEARVVRWARQILDVLDFLHGQSPPIIYRDLKPANIMIDHEGRAMLVDFGIARFLPPGGRGTQIGSVGYAPPEQYLGKMEPRSDLYSLAATIHHLLSGRDPQLEPPFSFPALRQVAPEVSEQVANAVMRALDKDIDKRPRSSREMKEALPVFGEEAGGPKAGSAAKAAPSAPPPLASMATVVLPRTQPPGPGLPLPVAPPTPVAPRPAPVKPYELKTVASEPTRRSLTADNPASSSRAAPPPPAPLASHAVSSTAATRDLGKEQAATGAKSGRNLLSRLKAGVDEVRGRVGEVRERVEELKSKVEEIQGRFSGSSPTAKTRELSGGPKGAPAHSRSRGPAESSAKPSPRASAAALKSRAAPPAPPRRPSPGVVRARPSGAGAPRRAPTGQASARAMNGAGLRSGASGLKNAAHLVALGEGLDFALDAERLVIGRSGAPNDPVDIDLALLTRGAGRVSRRHAEILKRGGEYFIRDLGSLNGTYIVGRGRLGRDQLYKLKDRDEIVLGGAKLEFRKGSVE